MAPKLGCVSSLWIAIFPPLVFIRENSRSLYIKKAHVCIRFGDPREPACICLSPGLYHYTAMTALERMNGPMEGDGAARSVSHWKSLGNICWGHVSIRMAALSTWLPREVSFWGYSQHLLAESCGHSEL